MRAVITKTRALCLAFFHWGNAWETRTSSSALSFMWGAGFELCVWVLHEFLRHKFQVCVLAIAVRQRRGFRLSRLGAAVMLRHDFQALRLSHRSDVETRVSTLAFWCCVVACVWSLDSAFWWLVLSDFWTVYRTPSKVFDISQLTGTDFEIL